MLLVICPIIKSLIYWHPSTLSLSIILCLTLTITFPQVKVYLTVEDDGEQAIVFSFPCHTVSPFSFIVVNRNV